jgi:hypothetical protein
MSQVIYLQPYFHLLLLLQIWGAEHKWSKSVIAIVAFTTTFACYSLLVRTVVHTGKLLVKKINDLFIFNLI